MSWHAHRGRATGTVGIAVVAVVLALAVSLLEIVPVTSQNLVLEARRAPGAVDVEDPWAAIWTSSDEQDVPLSVQQVAFPFGGGATSQVTARALYDDDNLYILLEWADDDADAAVNSSDAFTDAAAVQFPVNPDVSTAFTMGQPGAAVNIWQWKALWDADIAEGFSGSADRYPNTYADVYPNADDPIYGPAEAVGNPLAQQEHASPVENLIAEGYGTLTTSNVQDVVGAGEWRDGTWRVLLSRQLAAGQEGLASFAVGDTVSIAFAVWDGASGERNGLKSYAAWIDLALTGDTAPEPDEQPSDVVTDDDGGDAAVYWGLGLFAVAAVFALGVSWLVLRRQHPAS